MKLQLIVLLFASLQSLAQNVSTLSVDEFEKKLDSTKVQLLDVRRPDEYKSGHLHGAFQADWLDKKSFEERVQYLEKTKPVYLYCLIGGRSAAAANWLAEKGFITVNMQGGITAWKKEGKAVEAPDLINQTTDEEYKRLLHSDYLVLVDFGGEWCIPCKKMEPILNKLQQEHKEIKLVKIDAGIEEGLVKKYKIEALPVFILYNNGKEVWRQEGIIEKKDFDEAIKKYSN